MKLAPEPYLYAATQFGLEPTATRLLAAACAAARLGEFHGRNDTRRRNRRRGARV